MRIIYCQQSVVTEKDFAEEVRALLDVRKFVSDSFILTDVQEVRIKYIVDTIIDRLVKCRRIEPAAGDEAKSLLFVDRSSLSMVLANTMQGVYKSRLDGRLAYDPSWLVVTCSLTGQSLHKRQVAIARFAQPVNFGRQSQEVRFLIIVLAPSREKLTKSAWETGRTFATMFTDIGFRRRLLKAKNQDEFKLELLERAEDLARESRSQANSTEDLPEQPADRDSGKADLEYQICMRQESTFMEPIGSPLKGSQPSLPPISTLEFFDKGAFLQHEAALHLAGQNLNQGRKSIAICAAEGAGQQAPPVPSQRHFSFVSRQPRPSTDSNSTSASGGGGGFHGGRSFRRKSHKSLAEGSVEEDDSVGNLSKSIGQLGAGLLDDLKRRSKFYLSDFTDGFLGERSLYKTISTTIFLYFSVLLPCIAFGVVDTNNTDGAIDPKKTMIGQALGGLFFAVFSGQPLVVVMTTAPLCIYVKVIYQVSQDLEVSFGSFYAAVGLWMAFFLFLMSVTNSSNLMKHCTRSTEDIFALFTAFAFGTDGVREAVRSFQKYYWEPDCLATSSGAAGHAQVHTNVIPRSLTAHPHQETVVANLSATPVGPSHHALPAAAHEYQHHSDSNLATATTAAAATNAATAANQALHDGPSFSLMAQVSRCQRETCILFLFLMCGTLWLANSFSAFNRTPYLSARKREIIKDYALAISVLIFSFIGSYLFSEIRLDVFEFSEFTGLHVASLAHLSWAVWATSCLLGFMASVLFYIDQNICSAMVNNAPYKLKKGNYFHLDLLVLAVLNTFLSLTGLPWMHGKLPHSHLHSKALADYEERVDEGHIHQIIVNIRETRLTGILTSMLIALSLLAVPYPLSYIPLPVLSGVFLYTALAELKSNSMVERVCLLFTEQAAYPPNHYIRRCPQRKIHLFTLAQIIQLAIVSFIGFYPNPYVNMAFPLAVATFVPVRRVLLPKLFERRYLRSLDSPSLE